MTLIVIGVVCVVIGCWLDGHDNCWLHWHRHGPWTHWNYDWRARCDTCGRRRL